MQITKYASAPSYQAPGHTDMKMVRLQGREAGHSEALWLGVSEIPPGGGTTLEASGQEKMYVVLNGEISVFNDVERHLLETWDSCRIAPGEKRRLYNHTGKNATVLLAMPLG